MNLSKQKLLQIIREEIASLAEGEQEEPITSVPALEDYRLCRDVIYVGCDYATQQSLEATPVPPAVAGFACCAMTEGKARPQPMSPPGDDAAGKAKQFPPGMKAPPTGGYADVYHSQVLMAKANNFEIKAGTAPPPPPYVVDAAAPPSPNTP